MPWLLGIDEAGYGPNLGPFVVSAVACRVPDASQCLWQTLAAAVRRGGGRKDGRIVVDDSKVVYGGGKGLAGLERGVFPLFGLPPLTLAELAAKLCLDPGELLAERWFRGSSPLPLAAGADELEALRAKFVAAGEAAGVGGWRARCLAVCPARFNEIAERADSKSAVLAHGFVRLLAEALAALDDADAVHVHIDKQGGRNAYASQIQQALPGGVVWAVEESAARSRYRVFGLGREVGLTFEPRADANWACVAAASMLSKYLREACMREYNEFWSRLVPGLAPTAGYPGDAPRYWAAIRGAAAGLGLDESAVWRRR